jgi:hypothetical protein
MQPEDTTLWQDTGGAFYFAARQTVDLRVSAVRARGVFGNGDVMAEFVRHEPCPSCGSRNNLARYSDNSAYCFTEGCKHYEKGDGTIPEAQEETTKGRFGSKPGHISSAVQPTFRPKAHTARWKLAASQ